MRKFLLSISLLLISLTGFAQVGDSSQGLKIGLQFGVTLSTNRIDTGSDTVSVSTNGTGGRFSFGPVFDFPFGENYFVTTGLLYAPKRVGVKAINQNDGSEQQEVYNLQYLQVPLALKLYTNEVALDTKIFFQLGGMIDININEKSKDDTNFYVEDFTQFDAGLLLGAGVEFKAGTNTVLFGGFSYQRGLANTVATNVRMDDGIRIKNDLLSLNIGIKL